MSRYTNRTMKRADAMLANGLADPRDAIALGALMDTIDQEQARHKRKRDKLLRRLRKTISDIERKEAAGERPE
jgi:hypothetical protein